MPASLGSDIAAEQRIAELEAINRRLQRQLSAAKHKTEDLVDAVYRGARDAAVAVGKPAPIPKPERQRKAVDEEVAVLHATDLHFGKLTETFNSDIAAERVGLAVTKALRMTEIQRADHPVRRCVVMLGGDLIENTSIFPGQPFQIDSTSFAQVFRAASVIGEAILTLLGGFESVEVHEVWGNHGRIGRKGDSPRGDNMDRIVGRIARENLSQQKRLTWHDTDKVWHTIVTVGNWSALLIHGDSIKSFGGNTPSYGILRKLNAYATGVTEPFSDAFLGHFHQSMQLQLANGGRAWVTPSIESGSDYASEFFGSLGRPAQRLLFVQPERGRVTAEYLLYLDDAAHAK